MGLDNGIVLKYRGDVNPPSYVRIEKYDEFESNVEWEVCYWRKCHGIRDDIIGLLGGESDDSVYDLSIKDVENIMDLMYETLKSPEDWRSPIWSFDEMIRHLAQEIVNLSWLLEFMQENPHATAYFYDSY